MPAMLFHVSAITRRRLRLLKQLEGRPMGEIFERLVRREYKRHLKELDSIAADIGRAKPKEIALKVSGQLESLRRAAEQFAIPTASDEGDE